MTQEKRFQPMPLPPPILQPVEPVPLPDTRFEGEEAPEYDLVSVEEGVVVPTKKPVSDMDDLFEVPQETDNDMYTDDLFQVDEEDLDMEDDLSDLTKVSEEDIMGARPAPKKKVLYRRTSRPYRDYPTSLGGIR